MKKIHKIHVVLFLVIIFLASILTVFVGPKNNRITSEQRYRNTKPEINKASLLNGEYWKNFEAFFNDRVFFRENLIKIKTYIDYTFSKKDIISDVAVSKERNMLFRSRQDVDVFDEKQYQKDLYNWEKIKSYLDKVGTQLIVVGIPDQSDMFYDKYPEYLENNRITYLEDLNRLSHDLAEVGINFIDMDKYLRSKRDKYYFNADHHQNIRASLEIYKIVRESTSVGLLDIEDMINIDMLKEEFSGSHNRKLNNIVNEQFNLEVVNPIKPIKFNRFDNGKKVENIINKGNKKYYSYYMGGDIANTVIDTNREDLPDVMIIGDSTTNSLESIAWISSNKLTSLDFRHYKGDLISYLEKNPQDLIIVSVISGNYNNITNIMK